MGEPAAPGTRRCGAAGRDQVSRRSWLVQVVAGHPRTLAAAAFGVILFALLAWDVVPGRLLVAWDGFAIMLMALIGAHAARATPTRMAAYAEAQETGEWLVFSVTLLGILASVGAVLSQSSGLKEVSNGLRGYRVGLVAATLAVSWIVTHVVFALRYAHEYYEAAPDGFRGGLEFPGKQPPDYLDFLYFAFVIGMTFQVSDVQITHRHMRRLALIHGLLSFLFNTIIVALTVNLAAGLL